MAAVVQFAARCALVAAVVVGLPVTAGALQAVLT